MHIQDGTILQDTLCMRHVLYIDWLVYIFTISITSLASRKSVWDYLFQCHAQCMSCVTSIMDNPLEVPEVLREGLTRPKSCLGSFICSQTVGWFLHLWLYENPQLQMCPGVDSFVHLIMQLKDSGIWKFLGPQTSCYHCAQDLIAPDSSNDCLPVWCRTISLTNVISSSMGKVMKSWTES